MKNSWLCGVPNKQSSRRQWRERIFCWRAHHAPKNNHHLSLNWSSYFLTLKCLSRPLFISRLNLHLQKREREVPIAAYSARRPYKCYSAMALPLEISNITRRTTLLEFNLRDRHWQRSFHALIIQSNSPLTLGGREPQWRKVNSFVD
jgi:hypothetical protein